MVRVHFVLLRRGHRIGRRALRVRVPYVRWSGRFHAARRLLERIVIGFGSVLLSSCCGVGCGVSWIRVVDSAVSGLLWGSHDSSREDYFK
jgi:hypothetical protein